VGTGEDYEIDSQKAMGPEIAIPTSKLLFPGALTFQLRQ